MKTIGARSSDIAAIYLALIAVLTAPAVVIGLGAGLLGARSFSTYAAQQLNLDVASYTVGTTTLLAIICIGLALPLIAATIPIARADAHACPEGLARPRHHGAQDRRAFQDTPGPFAQWSGATHRAGRAQQLSPPGAAWVTLFALALGAALMTASNVYVSLIAAVDRSLDRRGDDVDARLLRPVDATVLLADISVLPGVSHAEAWGGALVALNTQASATGAAGGTVFWRRQPTPLCSMCRSSKDVGRRRRKSETLSSTANLQAIEPELVIGADVQLALGPRSCVGALSASSEEVAEPSLYTNPPTFAELAGADGLAGVIRVAAILARKTALPAKSRK